MTKSLEKVSCGPIQLFAPGVLWALFKIGVQKY